MRRFKAGRQRTHARRGHAGSMQISAQAEKCGLFTQFRGRSFSPCPRKAVVSPVSRTLRGASAAGTKAKILSRTEKSQEKTVFAVFLNKVAPGCPKASPGKQGFSLSHDSENKKTAIFRGSLTLDLPRKTHFLPNFSVSWGEFLPEKRWTYTTTLYRICFSYSRN